MKLNRMFITRRSGEGAILVPVGGAAFSGLVRGNKTFGAILELLEKDTAEAEIVAAMKARFNAPEEDLARDVRRALDELRRIGALDE